MSILHVIVDRWVDDTTQVYYHVKNHGDGLWQQVQHTFIDNTFIYDIVQVTQGFQQLFHFVLQQINVLQSTPFIMTTPLQIKIL